MTDKLLDFVEKRKENIEQKRRTFERILFKNMLGAYTVIHQDGVLHPVNLVNVSREGCLIQMPWNGPQDIKVELESEIVLKIYFTKSDFIPTVVHIKHATEFIDKDGLTYMNYGCEFDRSLPSFQALSAFIDFLYKFAEHSAVDKGEIKAFI